MAIVNVVIASALGVSLAVGTDQDAQVTHKHIAISDLTSLRGPAGPAGRDGRDGGNGRDGRDGKDCDSVDIEKVLTILFNKTQGAGGSSLDEGELLQKFNESIGYSLLRRIQELAENRRGMKGGSTYTRWGRKTCASNSELIYEGFAAGQNHVHSGGASNYQCLPLQPQYARHGRVNHQNYINGAEYESYNTNAFSSQVHDRNVPCARCYTRTRPSMMMIPARTTCPTSWTKEYQGYLMAGWHGHKRAYAYECVDKDPETITGSHANTDGALFYFVAATCPSLLHCPPYIEGAQLACVVCTK